LPGIALFDFDGTITTNDNFVGFIKFYLDSAEKGRYRRCSSRKNAHLHGVNSAFSAPRALISTFLSRISIGPLDLIQGYLRLLPSILAYRCGFITSTHIRTKINHVAFKGRSSNELSIQGAAYARKYLSGFVRPEAQKRIDWHKQRGDVVVVVSASLDVYLKSWCESQNVQLICSSLQSVDGLLTGDFLGDDCCGRFKVNKIKEQFDLSQYDRIYAYGDSKDDLPMLELAHESFYRWGAISKKL
jgi:HAD superfamily hydrolase (TIGR01490 family)